MLSSLWGHQSMSRKPHGPYQLMSVDSFWLLIKREVRKMWLFPLAAVSIWLMFNSYFTFTIDTREPTRKNHSVRVECEYQRINSLTLPELFIKEDHTFPWSPPLSFLLMTSSRMYLSDLYSTFSSIYTCRWPPFKNRENIDL